jgi:predicted RNase H-like nuclease (RuvC/YqgF family)
MATNRIKELEAEVTRLKWRLRGMEKERRAEEWRLRLKIAEMDGMILGLRAALIRQSVRLDTLEGA